MKILDRYVLRETLTALLAGLLFFVAVFIVVDIFEKIDTYLDNRVPAATVASFYLMSIPGIALQVLPMATLLSCLLALGQLGRTNELTAMRTAGFGPGRIAAPLIAMAALLSGAAFVVNEVVLPDLNAERLKLYREEIKKEGTEGTLIRSNLAYLGSGGRTFLIRTYDIAHREMREVVIQEVHENTLVGRIDAATARWERDRWVFRNGYTRRFDAGGETAARFTELTIPGLKEGPADFAEAEEDPKALSYWELEHYIGRLKQSGSRVQRYLVELYLKISFPLTNLIVVVIGVALALRNRRGGLALAFGLSVFISFLYYAAIRTGQALGHNGALPPLLAAWMGNLVFGALALELFRRARRGG
ncbi:MAG TPA: LPS export ABC transporter permease LptG [Candidatus Eisenbacteria bacterium]|nr:LPS export ABC transporter permease LptG [Candidatus Eisenbacteria bacterium]